MEPKVNVCQECSAEFTPHKRHPSQKFCSERCRRLRKWRDYNDRMRRNPEKHARKKAYLRAYHETHRPVSPAFHDRPHHPTRRDLAIAGALCRRCASVAPEPGRTQCRACLDMARANMSAWYARTKLLGLCLRCGGPKQEHKSFCVECSAENKAGWRELFERKRRKVERSERVEALKVFERDGWICQICGRQTRRDKRGTKHPMAPELDHVVPVSRGGAHTYANTQTACKRCNMAKGNRSSCGQTRLFNDINIIRASQ